MQLYLDSYGAFLNVKNGKFQITPKHNDPVSFATDDVDVIFLTEGVTATSDAMMLALDKGIPIVLLNYLGQAVGQVWSGRFGSIATIRRNQLKFSETREGWQWMAQTLAQKIDTQRLILQQLPEYYPHLFDKNALTRQGRNCATLDGLAKNLKRYTFGDTDFKRMAMEFRAFEATASRHYFRFIASIMPTPKWQFESRSFRPAKDFFNCLLNYLYGMLYAQVELSLIKVGIDPALGVLHVDRYNRPPMVYDFIEPYRHWADWIAIELALADAVPEDAFITSFENEGEYSGYWLSGKGKGIVITRFLAYLNDTIIYQKKQQKRLIVLDMDAQKLASYLKTLNT
jgi:CRISP-associated protein Cas1